MKPIVVLDAGPLGLLSNHRVTNANLAIRAWADALLNHGRRVVIPEVADFEVRRELIRRHSKLSLGALDSMQVAYEYLAASTAHFRRAAQLWADARNAGIPTAHHHELDCDVLLVA